jgi:hypothetical protein
LCFSVFNWEVRLDLGLTFYEIQTTTTTTTTTAMFEYLSYTQIAYFSYLNQNVVGLC